MFPTHKVKSELTGAFPRHIRGSLDATVEVALTGHANHSFSFALVQRWKVVGKHTLAPLLDWWDWRLCLIVIESCFAEKRLEIVMRSPSKNPNLVVTWVLKVSNPQTASDHILRGLPHTYKNITGPGNGTEIVNKCTCTYICHSVKNLVESILACFAELRVVA